MSNIQAFCGLPGNGSFEVFIDADGTFGRCFLWSAISTTSHVLLAVVCSFLIGSTKQTGSGAKRAPVYLVLTAIAAMSALSVVVEMVLSYALHHPQQHPPVYVLGRSIAFTSWLLCLILLSRMKIVTDSTRKTTRCLLVPFLLVLVSSSMQLQFVLKMSDFSRIVPVDYLGVIVDFALNIFFFFSCLWCVIFTRRFVAGSYGELHEEGAQKREETINLGVGESRNIISKIVFWWTDKLLQKGLRGQLEEPEDLFTLPDDMKTQKIRHTALETWRTTRSNLLRSDKKDPITIPLFSILNKCFGKVFYGIGILKLLCVILQLVQPMLVELLVTYVSHPEQPLVDGIYYTLAFFATSLVSVLFQHHYDYQKKKTNLQVSIRFC